MLAWQAAWQAASRATSMWSCAVLPAWFRSLAVAALGAPAISTSSPEASLGIQGCCTLPREPQRRLQHVESRRTCASTPSAAYKTRPCSHVCSLTRPGLSALHLCAGGCTGDCTGAPRGTSLFNVSPPDNATFSTQSWRSTSLLLLDDIHVRHYSVRPADTSTITMR